MRFQIAKRDLEDSLKVVLPSLASSGNDLLSTHFLFRLRPNLPEGAEPVVDVLTYSGRLFSASPMKAKVLDPTGQAFSIEGKRLRKWLAVVPDAALEFGVDDAVVSAKSPIGTQKFQALDPEKFPYWDQQVVDAKVTGTLQARRLAQVFDHAKRFVSDNEGAEPHLCVVEVRAGILWATNHKAITLIRAAGLENCGFRIHGKSLGGFQSFLDTFPGDASVEVLEHDRSLFLRRGDGAMFGEALFQARFPDIPIDMDEENHHVWTLSREDVLRAIGFLAAGAAWEDPRLRFTQKGSQVVLSMSNPTKDTIELTLDPKGMTSDANAMPIPAEGFLLDNDCLTSILNTRKDQDEVAMGINVVKQTKGGKTLTRGYIRFVYDVEGDKYLTIHAWLR